MAEHAEVEQPAAAAQPGTPAEPARRRRRVRREAESEQVSTAADVDLPSTLFSLADGETAGSERNLRGLVGSGSSQVTPPAAMRARDAARPRPEDLARAETELQIVRRNWTPGAETPRERTGPRWSARTGEGV